MSRTSKSVTPTMENNFNSRLSVGRVDWWSILIYAILVIAGWLNIYAAVYDDMHSSIFDISQRYGMQLLWMGVSAFLAISILLIDAKYYHMLAFPLYWLTILILLVVLFVGKEVNGGPVYELLFVRSAQLAGSAASLCHYRPAGGHHHAPKRYGFRIGVWIVPVHVVPRGI